MSDKKKEILKEAAEEPIQEKAAMDTDTEAKEEAHVEAVKDSKSMERAQAGHMRVKHLRGWVDKETHSVKRKSVEGVKGSVSFSGFIEG